MVFRYPRWLGRAKVTTRDRQWPRAFVTDLSPIDRPLRAAQGTPDDPNVATPALRHLVKSAPTIQPEQSDPHGIADAPRPPSASEKSCADIGRGRGLHYERIDDGKFPLCGNRYRCWPETSTTGYHIYKRDMQQKSIAPTLVDSYPTAADTYYHFDNSASHFRVFRAKGQRLDMGDTPGVAAGRDAANAVAARFRGDPDDPAIANTQARAATANAQDQARLNRINDRNHTFWQHEAPKTTPTATTPAVTVDRIGLKANHAQRVAFEKQRIASVNATNDRFWSKYKP